MALKTTLRDIEIDLDENDVSIGYFPLRCNYNFLFLLLGLLKPKCLRLRVLEGEPENVERILSYCAGNFAKWFFKYNMHFQLFLVLRFAAFTMKKV